MHCPLTQHNCQDAECLERGCTLQRGVAYSQLAQPNLPPDAILQAQSDALEAHSLKYHHCAQVFALSSGKFALFGSYQIASGIDLLAIGTWAELEQHVKDYRVLADRVAAEPRRLSLRPKAGSVAALDYSALFGEVS